MVIAIRHPSERAPRYAGLRMTADDFLALSDDGFRYELIDGVIVMSPSPTPEHQDVRGEIEYQLRDFARSKAVGWVLSEVDVRLGPKLVYRPDLIFISSVGHSNRPKRIDFAPELVVEVLSPGTAALDHETKRNDYAKAGVLEYWIVDPSSGGVQFLRLSRGRYTEIKSVRDRFASVAVNGFKLDLKAVRAAANS